jgi:carbon monoxide dehydrogenase subunit G
VKLAGEHRFAVSRERLWQALTDPTLLARVLPGCEPLEEIGRSSWRAAMTVAIGPVKGRFAGTLALFDLEPPERYRMKIDGTGQAGFLSGEGAVELHEVEGGSRLTYEVDAQVGGRIASVGQRLVESSGRVLAKQGLEGLERELAASVDDEPDAATGTGASAVVGEVPAVADEDFVGARDTATDESDDAAPDEGVEPDAAPIAKRTRRPPSGAAFVARFLWGLLGELPVSWRYAALGVGTGLLFVLLLLLALK